LGSDFENLPKVISIVTKAVSVPVIVKFCPDGNNLALASQIAIKAGASAAGHCGNRLGIPDIDIRRPRSSIYRLQDQITLGCLSGTWLKPLALRDTYQMRCALGPEAFIIGSGGVSDLESAVQQIMVGSDMVWICTETMLKGFDWLPKVLDGLEKYMSEMGYKSIRDFRDILLGNIASVQDLTIHSGYAEVDTAKCSACGRFLKIGHCNALSLKGEKSEKKAHVNREKCLACSTCIDVCPQKAINMITTQEKK
jgi:ferredoxin